MADFDPGNYQYSITIQSSLTGTPGTIPQSTACLLQMWGAGGGGGGAPATPSRVDADGYANATGGGGGGGGAYGLIKIVDSTLLQGTTPYLAFIGAGGIGQYYGSPTYNGQDGGATTLQFPTIQTNVQVSGGVGGIGGQAGSQGGGGGDGGVGAFIVSDGGTNYFQIGSSVSFGGGGGINLVPGDSDQIYGATGGNGYLNGGFGGPGYNGNSGYATNNTATPTNTRAGYGGGSNGSRGGC